MWSQVSEPRLNRNKEAKAVDPQAILTDLSNKEAEEETETENSRSGDVTTLLPPLGFYKFVFLLQEMY